MTGAAFARRVRASPEPLRGADLAEAMLRYRRGQVPFLGAKTDQRAVQQFVRDHDRELSNLSKREASKHCS